MLFDAHFHVIDDRFPLVENQGYLPPPFRVEDYRKETAGLRVVGGAVVSGSFQGFDQGYLRAALRELGPRFVGVTQLPPTAPDTQILELDAVGVRAVRFNVRRGGSAGLADLDAVARRVYEVAGWHVELYIDARDLPDLLPTLGALPAVSVDHLGLSADGLPHLLRLVDLGAKVKATGFGRVDLDVPAALRAVAAVSPDALMFGTDLPSTRASRPFRPDDVDVLVHALDDEGLVRKALLDNARDFYRLTPDVAGAGAPG